MILPQRRRRDEIFSRALTERATLVCLAVGVVLRVALSLVNREANDDHVEVILRIMAGGPQPMILTCNECFQPKLYHLLCARFAAALGAFTRDDVILAGQFLNVLLGTVTLIVAYYFIRRLSSDPLVRFIATSWIALNPALLGIHVQATNDTLVIFTGTVLIASLAAAIRHERATSWPLVVAGLAAGLAPHIKGNGIVLALGGLTAIAAIVWRRSSSGKIIRTAAAVVAVLLIAFLGARVNKSYQHNFRATGQLLAINMQPAPAPSFLSESVVYRPGVTSVVGAFLTFRIFNLLKVPYVPEAAAPYPLHKTSLWSQLYARTYLLLFEQWPPSWRSDTPLGLVSSRAVLMLGLIPTLFLLAGIADAISRPRQMNPEARVHLLFVLAMLAFSVAYSYRYRDVAVMKVIFVLPALLSFVYFYVEGLRGRLSQPSFRAAVTIAHTAMLVLWTMEEIGLLVRLARES